MRTQLIPSSGLPHTKASFHLLKGSLPITNTLSMSVTNPQSKKYQDLPDLPDLPDLQDFLGSQEILDLLGILGILDFPDRQGQ
jgi:hypothetical protein